jgi:glycerophosphoryl diester phosphodiesterase
LAPRRWPRKNNIVATLVIAHRGASAEKPENTLAAFRRAVRLKVDGIELDVQVSRDGVPVVFHDPNLFRLTGVRGKVSSRTWRELKKLRVSGTEPIPRLVDVLRLTRRRVLVQIEMKAGVPVAPIVRIVKAARTGEEAILASFSPTLVREARRLASTMPRMLISEGRQTPAALVRQLAALGARGLSVHHRVIRHAGWLRYFHSRGYLVWGWTVNDKTRMRRLAGWGIDAILTDNPALLCAVLRQKS